MKDFLKIVCLALLVTALVTYGVWYSLRDYEQGSNYKIIQYPEYTKLQTYIWGERMGESLLCYSNAVDFTVDNFDSISFAEKAKAEKLIKYFETLNKED